jgi:hypothetical protein
MKSWIKQNWFILLLIIIIILFGICVCNILFCLENTDQENINNRLLLNKEFQSKMQLDVMHTACTDNGFYLRCSSILKDKPIKYECSSYGCEWIIQ